MENKIIETFKKDYEELNEWMDDNHTYQVNEPKIVSCKKMAGTDGGYAVVVEFVDFYGCRMSADLAWCNETNKIEDWGI